MKTYNYSLILLCAGAGTRTALDVNKVLYKINDNELFKYTLSKFNNVCIKERILVVSEVDYDYFKSLNLDCKIVLGGNTRQQSVYNALLASDSDHVIIHDGARPFVASHDVEELINKHEDTIILCEKTIDTIKVVCNNEVHSTLDRSTLINTQTPQLFNKADLIKAHDKAVKDNYTATDDSDLIKKYLNKKVQYMYNSTFNGKVTTKSDIIIAELLLKEVKL